MPFCANCGSQTQGRFCAKCGAEVPGGADAGGAPAAGGAHPATQGMADNVASTLCYALGLITGILFLVLEPYNKNRVVRFHAFQSIFVSIAAFVLNMVLGMVISLLLGAASLWGLVALLNLLIGLAFLALWLYLLVMTYQGKTVVLPIIGPLAQKQA